MTKSKLMSLPEAITRFVASGDAIAMGTAQETLIPFAAGQEIIRQKKKDLTLIGPISDILFDQLIGGGCVDRIRASWVGNVITGSCYNFRRAVENGAVQIEDHSNLTISMALRAGAMGVPFMPARSALGSDLYKTNAGLKTISCPFTGERLTAVAAISPDAAIIHAQRADKFGNAHVWGNLGITREACLSSRKVIITVEEVVSPEVISSDPNRVIIPGFLVGAVVHAPWGAYPSPVPGHYNRDHDAFIAYRNATQTPAKFDEWKIKWIDNVRDAHDRFHLIGKEKMASLALKKHIPSEPADFGY
jgi:glutaconate CoA-transferase subunit A